MTPCPLCQHVPYEDSQPDSNGYDTFCGNCGCKLWDVTTRPAGMVINREAAARERDMWSAYVEMWAGLAHKAHEYPVIVTMYHDAKERAEESSERAQDATHEDTEFAASLARLRGL